MGVGHMKVKAAFMQQFMEGVPSNSMPHSDARESRGLRRLSARVPI
jgi:hypothetical protein